MLLFGFTHNELGAVDQGSLNLLHSVAVFMQFVATEQVNVDGSIVVQQMIPTEQQLKIVLQQTIHVMKANRKANRCTTIGSGEADA